MITTAVLIISAVAMFVLVIWLVGSMLPEEFCLG